jgi:hypothetical protein
MLGSLGGRGFCASAGGFVFEGGKAVTYTTLALHNFEMKINRKMDQNRQAGTEL